MPGRQLVDEAELAVVVTRLDLVEDRRVDVGAEGLARALGHHDLLLEPATAHVEDHLRLVDQEAPLDDVARLDPVEGEDLVSFDETRSGCG